MLVTAGLEQAQHPAACAEPAETGSGRILLGIFEALNLAGIPYCVLHGYDDFPDQIKSDVDCIIDRSVTSQQLSALFHQNENLIGAEVVRSRGRFFVFWSDHADGTRSFLSLDLSADCEVDGVAYQTGAEVLLTRRRFGRFWIPAADHEFGCYLVRTIAKGRIEDVRTAKLNSLYHQDPAGCEQQILRYWTPRQSEQILLAARTADWTAVQRCLPALQAELRRRAVRRRPGRFAANRLQGLSARMSRVCRPDGVSVALLGPDGAGKSSVIEALGPKLAAVLPRSTCYGFTPALIHHLRHGDYRPNVEPHALSPRSYTASVLRALLYWLPYYTLGYSVRIRDLARSMLVLNDRHFVDALVDSKRYRYGGPMWLLRLIWRVIPKPHLIVLLDAPAEVLQARKQEVSFEETARQRDAYLALVRGLGNGHAVDATQSREDVADEVSEIVLRHMAARNIRRLGLRTNAPRSDGPIPPERSRPDALTMPGANPVDLIFGAGSLPRSLAAEAVPYHRD